MRRPITSIFVTLAIVAVFSVSTVGQSETLSIVERSALLGKLSTAVHTVKDMPAAVLPEEPSGKQFPVGNRFMPSRFGFKAGALLGGAVGCLSAIEGWSADPSNNVFKAVTHYDSYRDVVRSGIIGAAVGGLSGLLFGELVEVVSRRRR